MWPVLLGDFNVTPKVGLSQSVRLQSLVQGQACDRNGLIRVNPGTVLLRMLGRLKLCPSGYVDVELGAACMTEGQVERLKTEQKGRCKETESSRA